MDSPEAGSAAIIAARDRAVLDLFGAISDRTAGVLAANEDWAMSGAREGQYVVDLDVDDVCVQPLLDAGFDVLSEESGPRSATDGGASPLGTVVVDPLDGSTNASLGLPWYATALCLVRDGEPSVAMVTNLVTGERYTAVRDRGADRNGRPILVARPAALDDAILAVNGWPDANWGWRQFRAMGAAALDICAVGRGAFDAYVDATESSLGVWDYVASILVVTEAGGVVADAEGRELVVLDHAARRTPIVASNEALLADLRAVR